MVSDCVVLAMFNCDGDGHGEGAAYKVKNVAFGSGFAMMALSHMSSARDVLKFSAVLSA